MMKKIFLSSPGFWKTTPGSVTVSEVAAPERPPPPTHRPISSATTPGCAWLRVRTPSELDCCQSNGALCFINPLFIKVHKRDTCEHTPKPHHLVQREEFHSNNIKTNNGDGGSVTNNSQFCSSDQLDSSLQNREQYNQSSENNENHGRHKTSAAEACPRLPPPRPPPPRFPPQRLGPVRQGSMPVMASWINLSKEKERDQGGSRLSRLGSSLSISPSSSPPNRLSLSAPISIPWPSLPISLPSLSSSPRRAMASSSSSQEDAQCHLALQDSTIEEALVRAKLFHRDDSRSPPQNSCHPPESSLKTGNKEEGCVGQRLSDMSILTDSSDSLDDTQSPSFFLPPLHDPNPPTMDDFDTHLPLSLPPPVRPYMAEDDDDEEEDEDDADYGLSLESDQDQDLTIAPPGHRLKRRPSTGALVLLRKMSFVINSLITPEKRAIHRVVELSRNKSSYFGCLVQDYLSYMDQGAGTQAWQSYATGMELLQTLRQFITQMKSYLTQSSELQPPIESLIPEEQIGEHQHHKLMLCHVYFKMSPGAAATL